MCAEDGKSSCLLAKDCSDVYACGYSTSGVYIVTSADGPLRIYCEMVSGGENDRGQWAVRISMSLSLIFQIVARVFYLYFFIENTLQNLLLFQNKLVRWITIVWNDFWMYQVILRRMNGEVNFFRPWESYKWDFGNKAGEYWLGECFCDIQEIKSKHRERPNNHRQRVLIRTAV